MKIIPAFTSCLEKLISYCLPLAFVLRKYYRPIVQREVRLGEIKENDDVLCIGGGALPWTAIEIAVQTGAKVYVVDCDQIAVLRASKLIKLLNLENLVKVCKGDGQSIDVSPYSVAHIALQAAPQETILSHLLEKGRCNARILMRCPKKGISCFYGKTCNTQCFCTDSISQSFSTMKSTLLFVKPSTGGYFEYEKNSIFTNRDLTCLPLRVER
ncbi:hypothetical protein [Evansella tamaricis]|uniref:Nicotianamine synthase n=1 Tax=Evansella tamaricis TaxID=2069301 RepID=A0ABS6J9N2_9BACI|nr:hypothetical protein [Evansella tamaricis]MBU9710391.1 hypothetical protein [Evansella tamaricis]